MAFTLPRSQVPTGNEMIKIFLVSPELPISVT